MQIARTAWPAYLCGRPITSPVRKNVTATMEPCDTPRYSRGRLTCSPASTSRSRGPWHRGTLRTSCTCDTPAPSPWRPANTEIAVSNRQSLPQLTASTCITPARCKSKDKTLPRLTSFPVKASLQKRARVWQGHQLRPTTQQPRSQDFAQEGPRDIFSQRSYFKLYYFHATLIDVMLKLGRIQFYLV